MTSAYSLVSASEHELDFESSSDLSSSLVEPARDGDGQMLPLQSRRSPRLSVMAPATLPEGYEFETRIGTSRIMVTVPPGGVEEGQMFDVPLPPAVTSAGSIRIPVGHWRDSLLGCFNYGPCHPHLWTGLCCALCKSGGQASRLCWERVILYRTSHSHGLRN